MKIRTDFVTNSSSSSFVAINMSSDILQRYLEDHELEEIFDQVTYPYMDWRILQAELEQSFALSLCAILEKFLEDNEHGELDEECGAEIDYDEVSALIEFLKSNREVIDAQLEGSIEISVANGEDGYAYYQLLKYDDAQGCLTKWPCADGWNYEPGGGYEKIQQFGCDLLEGEIAELAEMAYTPIWEIAFDNDALAVAIEKTGVTEEFAISPAGEEVVMPQREVDEPAVAAALPQTLEECEEIFECYAANGQVVIRGVNKSCAELVIPGIIDDMPVVIAQYSFNGDKKLEKLVLMEGVAELGADCFSGCKKLREVTFASTITTFGSGVFSGTPWLSSQGDWLIVNDVLLKYSGSAQELVIPDGVKRIADFACAWQRSLRSVVIPDSVTEIGDSVFSFCSGLTDITLPQHEIKFGKNPFDNTGWQDSQEGFAVINGVLLGMPMNYYHSELAKTDTLTVPDGVTVIGDDAFGTGLFEWNHIKKVILPEGLKTIGASAFRRFTVLEEINLPASLTEIGEFAFENCKALRTVGLPDGLVSIGRCAFSETGLKMAYIPDSVKELGASCYARCQNLQSIRLPKRIEVIPSAFVHSCKALTEVEMPTETEIIFDDAFESCSSLTEIIIPANVEGLGRRVFFGCVGLTELHLPDSLEIMGWAAFKHSGLRSLVIPEGVTVLADEIFEHCTALEEVSLPASLESIGSGAFNDCPNLTLNVPAGSFAEEYAKKNGLKYTVR